MEKYEVVGDVRGMGLFLGVEMVEDKVTKEPSPRAADYVQKRCMELGVQVSSGGGSSRSRRRRRSKGGVGGGGGG